ncbi:3-ketoacyl-ACP reductase FabG2 [Citrobacter rodentium]|uniref:Short chain dehydrogenase n=2 Tax=Citrobacter rodentium TaxID=67825 RepID=D2TKQ9_CITRI|nr:3-ketoacyl-ACP reductase FabG2 [Citrobacter rodentium]KIQ50110.1 3-ketoacyl-ACP reductase [Citrobacter rodentium]QBY30602.1 3-oxoacyl-ACP reductase FabG [Citrobacter rodentium]UHO32028.1 3-ketoacyl-ACP reductase FabG2 [Citrobacter rodentium NBRC 105723 = DSM 16636]CBG91023.1 putative short chain dehydrogenase [Citrobacter rodentium ICC168]HAT8011349.1 3-oxoacyl-ACP reductase [Citrobacter rodentium NBRC 105723 = DSM 16636]
MSRSVLVTGASKGIGRAIARKLAADGFVVGVHYHRDAAGAQATLDAIQDVGGAGRLLCFDVANREQCREALEQDLNAHGAWYGVVSNAGITLDAAFPALSDDDWDAVIHTNLDSFYNVIQPCIMPMIGARRGGRIITLSSVSGVMGNRGQVNYSAAKAGIIGATKALAIELAKRKITVNCIAPGLIDTGMIDMEEAALKEAMAMIPMKRMGQADEVAGLTSYLMSDIAGYVTRQVISINGGML